MKGAVDKIALLALCLLLLGPMQSFAADPTQEAILRELQALKMRVGELENKLQLAQKSAQDAQKAAAEAYATSGRSLKMSQEVAKTKSQQPEGLLTEAGKRLKVYGAIELEGSYSNRKPNNGKSVTDSDFTLSTAEIFFDATINKYTKGILHLLYEQGDTDPINIDEAFILIGQTDDMPFYFLGGRMYPAIGLFETYMVSDPITKNVFETQATAVEIGWAQDWFNVGAGTYNSSVHQASDSPDNTINTYYVRAQFDAVQDAIANGLDINAGVAYTNNIAGGNLGDEVVDDQLKDLVAGLSFMLNVQYKWAVFNAEYITALDDFQAGELSFASGKAKPYAYNLELAFMPLDKWTFAVRYEGSGDLGDFEPERQYGFNVSWNLLPDTRLSLEYLRGDYANDDERDLVTTQLAVAF
ncbi:MAG: LbtU family siderophore porin [Proteobacteria bacterium]|nr:LbtU family siderophore porin [Pseudomonadota bacterium]MBU1449628.1 LbtU family siderophore porin [Pseudomonadota bacterium]MBU2469957.1 LbtU family siderophore porin [Pseudomonadota bacterium]MBU2517980.1 LbtU family siderophore porin [Pseudomonadota bacterium]